MPSSERLLSAALIDIDGTLTETSSVSWLDFTENLWIMSGESIGKAKAMRSLHGQIFEQFRKDHAVLKTAAEKKNLIAQLNTDLFDKVWLPSGLPLDRKTVEQISRAALTTRLRKDGLRFLNFLSILKDQLNIPVFVLTSANSVLADVIAKDFSLSGGKASALMNFDEDGKWTGFDLDADLNRSKVRNVNKLKEEGKLSFPSNEVFVLGDGPTEIELIEYFNNNAIISTEPIDSDKVAVYINSLDQAMELMYEQLGPDAETLNLPAEMSAILRTRQPN